MRLHVEVGDGDVDAFRRLDAQVPATVALVRVRLWVVGTRQLARRRRQLAAATCDVTTRYVLPLVGGVA